MIKLWFTYLKSPIGLIEISGNESGVTHIQFVEKKEKRASRNPQAKEALAQLKDYFSGIRKTFSLPLAPSGTNFQLNVWDELQKIPFAKTINYEMLAKKLGDIKVIRAAATANGENPLAIVIPCHRVIGKDGSLTGYSGGMWRKKWLLDFEQRDVQMRLL